MNLPIRLILGPSTDLKIVYQNGLGLPNSELQQSELIAIIKVATNTVLL